MSMVLGGMIQLELETKNRKQIRKYVLVNMWACWSRDLDSRRRRTDLWTRFSQTKFQWISKCFISSWKTTLLPIWIALLLSQNNEVERDWGVVTMSVESQCNQTSSWVASTTWKFNFLYGHRLSVFKYYIKW